MAKFRRCFASRAQVHILPGPVVGHERALPSGRSGKLRIGAGLVLANNGATFLIPVNDSHSVANPQRGRFGHPLSAAWAMGVAQSVPKEGLIVMPTCSQCPVRESAICHSLSVDALDQLSRTGRRQTLLAGQTLMWEGEEAMLVGNVVDGIFKLSASLSDGRDQVLGIAYPSDFIGRAFGAKSHHSGTALTDAEVCTFRRSEFDDLARQHADLEHDLLERSLAELDRLRKWLQVLGTMTAAGRVAVFLIEMASRLCPEIESEAGPVRFTLPVGRQDIADLLGLTIETVSRQLTIMRNRQIIGTPDRRSIVILDRRALAACAAGA